MGSSNRNWSHSSRHDQLRSSKCDQSRSTKRDRQHATNSRAFRLGLGCAIGVAVVYFGGVAAFANVFAPGTTVNGESAALKSTAQLSKDLTQQLSNADVKVSGEGMDLTLNADDVSLGIDSDSLAQSARAQSDPWSWPLTISQGQTVEVTPQLSFDEQKLEEKISAAVDSINQQATPSENAKLDFDSSSVSYVITPEVNGTELDKDVVLQEVKDALAQSKTSVELDNSARILPTLTADSPTLVSAQQQANAYLEATQTLTANGANVATVDSARIASWVTVDEQGQVSLDTAAITTWTQGELSKQLDTVGTTRNFTRPDGKAISVSGGSWGWCIDGAQLADNIASAIEAGQAGSINVPWKTQGAVWNPGGSEWTRYIDVDLSEQHARLYDESGAVIWESDFVSGDTTKDGRATPEGVYAVNGNKGVDQTLIGLDENHDGEPDYRTPVAYWIPFVNNMVAFHDAPWRSSFGGNIYKGNGSHGCINLPSSAAQSLYDASRVGDVVVVHW